MKFIIEQSKEELTPVAGLALVGALLNKCNLKRRLDKTKVPGVNIPLITHGDVAKAYVGLLCQGKSDFDHIEPLREDNFFALALQLNETPSSPTLRQRLDMGARSSQWNRIILEESTTIVKRTNAPLTPITLGSSDAKRQYVPVDVDVSPFDNSKTKKEGVSRTYKGHDGYAPIFAYLGQEGYCVNAELRPGKDHCQNGTVTFLTDTILYARRITQLPLLVRLDSGNDSADNICVFENEETKAHYIIKRNIRKESKEAWLATAKVNGVGCIERVGKTVYIGSIMRKPRGFETPIRLVYRVVERTILAKGQMLLVPDIEVETYWTSLPDPESTIIKLYHDHGTSEQFHSELKTDFWIWKDYPAANSRPMI